MGLYSYSDWVKEIGRESSNLTSLLDPRRHHKDGGHQYTALVVSHLELRIVVQVLLLECGPLPSLGALASDCQPPRWDAGTLGRWGARHVGGGSWRKPLAPFLIDLLNPTLRMGLDRATTCAWRRCARRWQPGEEL